MVTSDPLVVFHTWKAAGEGSWGHDDLGQAFFNGGGGKQGFGVSRDQVLPLIGDMVNVLAGTGDAVAAARDVLLAAEQSNTELAGGRPGWGAGQRAGHERQQLSAAALYSGDDGERPAAGRAGLDDEHGGIGGAGL